jgi:hypothetical protein
MTVTTTPLTITRIDVAPANVALCVLCERTTLVPMPWQDGQSSCCRQCFRAQRNVFLKR